MSRLDPELYRNDSFSDISPYDSQPIGDVTRGNTPTRLTAQKYVKHNCINKNIKKLNVPVSKENSNAPMENLTHRKKIIDPNSNREIYRRSLERKRINEFFKHNGGQGAQPNEETYRSSIKHN